MNEMIKILILEDDSQERTCFKQAVSEVTDITIIGNTNNASEALTIAKTQLPHAIIVDLELHDGYGNGLQFLSELQNTAMPNKPFILVTTNNSSRTTHEAARALGADFILTKYEASYSSEYVLNFLKMMHSTMHGTSSNASFVPTTGNKSVVATQDITDTELIKFIREELILIGINPKSVGFNYLADAVLIKLKDSHANIYKELGPKYKKSDPSIERAMQYAINCAWRSGDPDELLQKYTARINSDRGIPTIMEFIYFFVSKTQNNFGIK